MHFLSLILILPITSGGAFARNRGFAVSLDRAGLKTTGIVHCDQPRALDLKARLARHLERVPDAIRSDVMARLTTLFE